MTSSIRLLFSFIPKKSLIIYVLPAVVTSMIAGGVAPFMTFVVGQAFDAFATFSVIENSSRSDKDKLLRGVGLTALELIGLAIGALALSSVSSFLWISIGEKNVMGLRRAVYSSVAKKEISWYDLQMGDATGVGGMMAKFSRETDEVRMASSLASGMVIQYFTTCITCLVLAFLRSWVLTLVILSALPILVIIQGFSQSLATPILAQEHENVGVAGTMIDRAANAIATVKAFNAAAFEHGRTGQIFYRLFLDSGRINKLWASTSGISQFVMLAMFVQGFWFGSKLVREGKISAGAVMAVFWACLIASSNLQMCVPQLILLAKGKISMAALVTLIDNKPPSRKKIPSKCVGELAFYNVTFAYPSRPTVPVLNDVSLFLPAYETTFIVGSSGSGKSTIGHLIMNMYEPQEGYITLDETDRRRIDDSWLRSHVACVGQQGGAGVVIFDDKTVFENIAAAASKPPTSEDVEEACRAALLHEFVRGLPQGYDTLLGGGSGVGLSGGQKQRLSIARAKLRNPSILVLDEATSALDPTSRLLVFEAIKHWRRHKTTIIITHDLSQIEANNFVYVLKEGCVVEQGFRCDLEQQVHHLHHAERGEFRKMMESQESGSFLPEKQFVPNLREEFKQSYHEVERPCSPMSPMSPGGILPQQTFILRHLTFGNWMFDVMEDLAKARENIASPVERPTSSHNGIPQYDLHRRLSATVLLSNFHFPAPPAMAHTHKGRRYSLPTTHTSSTLTESYRGSLTVKKKDSLYAEEKLALEKSAVNAREARNSRPSARARWDEYGEEDSTYINIGKTKAEEFYAYENDEHQPAFWTLMHSVYMTVPQKYLLFIGLLFCVLSGLVTPVFSYLLSRLLYEVSIGAQNISVINFFGGLVLGVAAIDGLFLALKYYTMETSAMLWVTKMRNIALSRVLVQDKKWFDQPRNAPARLVQMIVKDADDARDLIAVVWGQFCIVVTMLSVGLIWALIRGWQLTLAGVAIAPIFALIMAFQTKLVAKCEVRSKRAREEVARHYYDTLINIRGIRSMAFDDAFKSQFEDSLDHSLVTGVQGAFVEGRTYGVASGLIYLAEALLFYIGGVLIARGTYTYLQMVEVLNLVVFTISIGSQLMSFTQKIAKSVQATSDFDRLMKLDIKTDESRGAFRPDMASSIKFNKVNFTYPSRSEAPILKEMNLHIDAGECVAVVGASGSGKSTIVSLIQRLYEPNSGSVTIGDIDTRLMDIQHLRDQVSVVSQQPHLFDASIRENIQYGQPFVTDFDIRCAAKAANIHDFIMSLPQQYDTHLGEDASLISGGQAQRLQIARAIARPCKVLILDECTSSLDKENRTAVLDTIQRATRGRTTIMVTHNLEAMLICDRIIVIQDGEVVEEGSYEELMEKKGIFTSFARRGEWLD